MAQFGLGLQVQVKQIKLVFTALWVLPPPRFRQEHEQDLLVGLVQITLFGFLGDLEWPRLQVKVRILHLC